MQTVWKYTIEVKDGVQKVNMPAGAIILHTRRTHGGQGVGEIDIWAQVHAENAMVIRIFAVTGTGHEKPAGGVHVGVAFDDDFGFVWHVWEI